MKQRRGFFAVLAVALLLSLLYSTNDVEATEVTVNRTFSSLPYDGEVRYPTTGGDGYDIAYNATSGTNYNYSLTFDVGQWFDGAFDYRISRGFVYFDTSAIPNNATLTDATLSLYVMGNYSTKDFNVTVQNGQSTYPHIPLEADDYYYIYYSGDGGNRNTTSISGSGYWNITLNSDGRSWINLEGTTKLCLRSSLDIGYVEPTGNEYIEVYAAEKGADYAPKLYLTYTTEGYLYILKGAYDETGVRDGAINCTLYRETEAAYSVVLNGEENVTSETIPVAFHFDLGENQSRIYYLKDTFEEIYVFKPSDPYYTYYVSLMDFVGITNGYLETLINVNGTDRIVERWRLDVLADIPFSLSWGVAYKIRLICDQGTYLFGTVVAEADTTIDLTITSNEFSIDYTSFGLNISVSASRENNTWIQVLYEDAANLTSWVYTDVQTRYGTSAYASNSSSSSIQLNWYSADNTTDYIVKVTIEHTTLGTLSYSVSLPAPSSGSSPFDLSFLGAWPVDATQIISLLIVLFFGSVASTKNAYAGLFLTILMAAFFTYITWLSISATILTVAIVFVFMLAFASYKDRRG